MNNPNRMFDLNIEETAAAIKAVGPKRTIIVKGEKGTGKTSILKMLSKELPKHTPVYFDGTTKDLGDMAIPDILGTSDNKQFVRMIPNEETGFHLDGPIILMVDEVGKMNPSVKNAMMRPFLERQFSDRTLHPESIVFGTTNLSGEGLGDVLMDHHKDRVTEVEMRKPTAIEWVEWGVQNGINPIILGWANDNPLLFQSFKDVPDPSENEYIWHPQAQRSHFVSPRSLHAASDWMWQRGVLSDKVLRAGLVGTVGPRGGHDAMTFAQMADQLPRLDDIKNNPDTAMIPTSGPAVVMVVTGAMQSLDASWVNSWMKYFMRLDNVVQGFFANAVRRWKEDNPCKKVVMSNKLYTDWCMANAHMFKADK